MFCCAGCAAAFETISGLGYRLVPFDTTALQAASEPTERRLQRALAVAGFAVGSVMLLSIGIWAGLAAGMGPATRTLWRWASALLALPAIAYAGMVFFRPALAALRHGRTNMDVPISLGVLLVSAMGLVETVNGGMHSYFDGAVTLLFFLLVARLLDHRARGQMRATVERLLALRQSDVAVLQHDGVAVRRAAHAVALGDLVLVGMGERIGVDGVVTSGTTRLDTSPVTGDSLPAAARAGQRVFAGTINLGAPIIVRATATGNATLPAECARLIEAAEAPRGRFAVLAERVAQRHAPAVHLCALATFLVWWLGLRASLGSALLTASAVLIVTCPCALALAVPAVQVIATGALFRRGILVKSRTALERLGKVDTVVFDKTGTLSEPILALVGEHDEATLRLAASLAACSRHPLAQSLVAAAGEVTPAAGVIEHPGQGLSLPGEAGEIRLGSRGFCGGASVDLSSVGGPGAGARGQRDDGAELWLLVPGRRPYRFGFGETLRRDAAATVARLSAMGLTVLLLSGDSEEPVGHAAYAAGISRWQYGCDAVAKVALVEELVRQGRGVLMVGDGMNHGACLAAASVSMSPATACDRSRIVADVVFQGRLLNPVATAILTARRAGRVTRQNLALSIGYNVLALPLAMTGLMTPWLAAAAMSISSLLVVTNSLRLRRCGNGLPPRSRSDRADTDDRGSQGGSPRA